MFTCMYEPNDESFRWERKEPAEKPESILYFCKQRLSVWTSNLAGQILTLALTTVWVDKFSALAARSHRWIITESHPRGSQYIYAAWLNLLNQKAAEESYKTFFYPQGRTRFNFFSLPSTSNILIHSSNASSSSTWLNSAKLVLVRVIVSWWASLLDDFAEK